ncbi:aldo/keto reductase [Kribbella sp.]|uniref:aldo/keto reductase n=1 Tax=Kribbella sp. TaxID=1871183 RepID=UPI002D5E2B72|nr:aldo/keto reductase [Kribbella sp.]HZX01473.1 aldo/keto reductase [Kribbella sp.]
MTFLGGTFGLGPRQVHRVGYGAMQLAGDGVFGPPRDRDEALRVLRAAVDAGVDHIDTAQFYGGGSVNQVLREALSPYPESLAIVSKVGSVRRLRPGELRRGIEENLAALGADRLAAVNYRLMNPAAPPDATFELGLAELGKARDEGLIEGVGLSNVSRDHLLRAVEQTDIVCVQNLFNLIERGSTDVLDECTARGIAFVPFCPLGLPGEQRGRLLSHPLLARHAERLGVTSAQLALGWLLGLAPNILLIPGTRTVAHLTENLEAAEPDQATQTALSRG